MMCNRLLILQAFSKSLIDGFRSTAPKISAHTSHAYWPAEISSIMYSIILTLLIIFFGCKTIA